MRIERLVIMVSGNGTNFQAVLDACGDGRINAKVVGVISSNPRAFALRRAQAANIPFLVISKKQYEDEKSHDDAIIKAIEQIGGQAVVLAGYMYILGRKVVQKYPIINVHPALIPSFCGKGFYGLRVHQAVIESGAKVSGATVHFVDEGTDTGPIIMQKCVEVRQDDTAETLAARVLPAEHEILVKSIALLCEGKLKIVGNKVQML